MSRYTPKFVLSQPRGEGGRGYRRSSCPLEGIALYGGIAEIVSPIAVSWAAKLGNRGASGSCSRGCSEDFGVPQHPRRLWLFPEFWKIVTNSYQQCANWLCIVKGEAQKNPLFW